MNELSPEAIRERAVVAGVLDILSAPFEITSEVADVLATLLEPFHQEGYVDEIELAVGFLEGPEQSIEDAAYHLENHRSHLLTLEEQFMAESELRESLASFQKELGEDSDPDAPFVFPTILGPDPT